MHALNPVAAIAQEGMQPVQATGASFTTGKNTHGFSLYEAFAVVAQTDARVQVIVALVQDGLTCAEFDAAVKEGIAQGAAADKLAGWNPPADAKGRDKYGPKQNTMVQRATEMRQVFGYLKLTHAEMHAGGYLETLKAARGWLKENNLTWDGNTTPTKEEKEAKAETVAMAEATKAAMLQLGHLRNTMSAGDWFAKVAKEAEAIVEREADKKTTERLTKLAQSIVEKEQPLDVYSIALALLKASMSQTGIDNERLLADLYEQAAPL